MAFKTTNGPEGGYGEEDKTRLFYVETPLHSFMIETSASDDQMEGAFVAYDCDNAEWLLINGWQCEFIEEDGRNGDDQMAERRAMGLTALD